MSTSVTAALANQGAAALFRSFRRDGFTDPESSLNPGFHERGWSALLRSPVLTLEARTPADVLPLIRQAEAAQASGRWAVLVLAYEAAQAFDPALATRPPGDFPLAWLAVFEDAEPLPPPGLDEGARVGEDPGPLWTSTIPDADYLGAVARVRELLRQGEAYQVNYTAPFAATSSGSAPDSLRRFLALGTAFEPGWAAWIDMGGWRIECLSPELFFRVEPTADGGRRVCARPMKGTEPRVSGQTSGQTSTLADCPKNRAENVMIVDLLRNDLGRVAIPGGVRVPRLFEVEAYGGLWQMTSTVEADLRPGAGLADVLAALFPCGSVTGAPKVRAMQIIKELELEPRGVYCGAIGLLAPGGRAAFCVPIRTIVTRVQCHAQPESRFGVGGGVTFDSTPEGELAERAAKAAFLARPAPDFRLIEALRLEDGRLDLLDLHLDRLAASALALGFALDRARARGALMEASAGRPSGVFKLRLELGRSGAVAIDAAPLDAFGAHPLRLALAAAPVDSRDPRLAHKTTRREVYDRALAEAKARDPGLVMDEVLLWNERGEVCEASRANLALEQNGALHTPPLAAGCLPGVMRRKLLETGRAVERVITVDELRRAQEVVLFNAVRGIMRGRLAFV